jgi:type III secretion protein V
LTTWDPRGFLVLSLSFALRRAAAQFQTDDMTQCDLDLLGDIFPDLVQATLERYTLSQVSLLLRELLEEEVSIRDMRSILESLLSVDGTTDVDLSRFIVFTAYTDGLCPAAAARSASDLTIAQLADFVRMSLKRYISHKYARGNTLLVYLVHATIEQRLGDVATRPLTAEEEKRLLTAIQDDLDNRPSTAASAVLLTSFEVRHALRTAIQRQFPRLAVLSYQELSPELNIQPLARISWA